ncbi:guanine deaminase [Chromatiales bacterium (ex Bugula neritina AB1)]|nr:guanine deaminase [Chromatiales bacterium (ex Bugula neritina AB1)]
MHTPSASCLKVMNDTLIGVDNNGIITAILEPGTDDYTACLQQAEHSKRLTRMTATQFMLPGLVDLHIHAPQWPQLGKALHLPLQDWLMNCTFPLEARYSDPEFAGAVYRSLVSTLLANGTTSAVYFATIHQQATQILADICVEKGQRAWVGRVAMDDPTQCPDYYRDTDTRSGLQQTEQLINSIRAIPGNHRERVQPIITPRFIPACTNEMLEGLGKLASQYNCPIQTHCSESDWEHQYVIDRLGKTDTEALHDFGLLTRKTVLAHSNLLTDSDMDTIGKHQSGIAHCPLSNSYFAGCVFPLRTALSKGLHIGLGTDISGGPSASMFDSCKHVISASRMLESGTDPEQAAEQRGVSDSRSNFIEAFYLATAGGGQVLDQRIGKFEPGYHFDAMLIDTSAKDSNLTVFPALDSDEDVFQKTIYGANRSNIRGVWVDGAQV